MGMSESEAWVYPTIAMCVAICILLSDKPQEMWQVTAKESVVRKSKNTMPRCELAICGDYPWVSKNRNCPEATIVLPSPKTHLWDVSFPSDTLIYKFTRNPMEQW